MDFIWGLPEGLKKGELVMKVVKPRPIGKSSFDFYRDMDFAKIEERILATLENIDETNK